MGREVVPLTREKQFACSQILIFCSPLSFFLLVIEKGRIWNDPLRDRKMDDARRRRRGAFGGVCVARASFKVRVAVYT